MKTTLFFLFLALSSCSKNNDTPQTPQDQLPQITTIGANTAGCIINGKVLIPKNEEQQFGGSPAYGLQRYSGVHFGSTNGDDYYAVQIVNKKDKGGGFIYLQLPNLINGIGNYIINQSNNEFYMDGPNNPHVIVKTYDGVNLGKVYLSGSNSGIIKITKFDFPNRIVSGIFNLTVYNKDNPNETIEITDGRFYINGFTLNQ